MHKKIIDDNFEAASRLLELAQLATDTTDSKIRSRINNIFLPLPNQIRSVSRMVRKINRDKYIVAIVERVYKIYKMYEQEEIDFDEMNEEIPKLCAFINHSLASFYVFESDLFFTPENPKDNPYEVQYRYVQKTIIGKNEKQFRKALKELDKNEAGVFNLALDRIGFLVGLSKSAIRKIWKQSKKKPKQAPSEIPTIFSQDLQRTLLEVIFNIPCSESLAEVKKLYKYSMQYSMHKLLGPPPTVSTNTLENAEKLSLKAKRSVIRRNKKENAR